MNRLTLCAIVGASALLASGAAAQLPPPLPNFAAIQIRTTDLGHRTWMLQGQGGNITVIAGDDGVIIVDTQFAPLHDKIKAAVAQVSNQPIRYVVNTHFHLDHVSGDQAFSLDGATIVSHQNVRRTLAAGTTNALTGIKIPPVPQGALPTLTYATTMPLSLRGRRVQLMHMPRAHTSGDTAVWIPDANVLAAGDIITHGARYAPIDVGDGGSINGIIAAVDVYLKLTNAQSKIVPGHGELMSRTELVAYRALLVDARNAVRKLKAAGKTEDQTVAAKPLAGDIQGRAGANDDQSVDFVRLIYRSVG